MHEADGVRPQGRVGTLGVWTMRMNGFSGLAAVVALAATAGTAVAGGYAEPVVEAETITVAEGAAGSTGMGVVLPLLIVLALAAVAGGVTGGLTK